MAAPLDEASSPATGQDEEYACRICQLEGTDDMPLLHPCKCKGSIKFVHEKCLDDWLKISNTNTCNVCSHPFQYTFVYKETPPHIVPFKIIIKRISSFKNPFIVVSLLGFGFLIIPMVFACYYHLYNLGFGAERPKKIYGYLVLGDVSFIKVFSSLTEPTQAFFSAVIYGWLFTILISFLCFYTYTVWLWSVNENFVEFIKFVRKRTGLTETETSTEVSSSEEDGNDIHTSPEALRVLAENQQEARDALVTQVLDILVNIIQFDGGTDESDENESRSQSRRDNMIDKLKDKVIELADLNLEREDLGRRLQTNAEETFLLHSNLFEGIDLQNEQSYDSADIQAIVDKQRLEMMISAFMKAEEAHKQREVLFEELKALRNEAQLATTAAALERDMIQLTAAAYNEGVRIAEADTGRERNIANNIGYQELSFDYGQLIRYLYETTYIDILLAIALILFLILGMLGLHYFTLSILCLLGLVSISALNEIMKALRVVINAILSIPVISTIQQIPLLVETTKYLQKLADSANNYLLAEILKSVLITPFPKLVNRISNWSEFSLVQLPFVELSYAIVFGFITFICISHSTLSGFEFICSLKKPGLDSILKLHFNKYIVLTELMIIIKVGSLFLMKLAVFPIIYGLQLNYFAVPILIQDISKVFVSECWWLSTLGLTLFNWIIGALFVYFCSLLFSFIRRDILRKGLLYFISSVEDTHTTFFRTAIGSFWVQFSKILLSCIIYSLFINSFRLVTQSISYIAPIEPFPFKIHCLSQIFYFAIGYPNKKYLYLLFDQLPYFFSCYWSMIFTKTCSALRLSSFILGQDIVSETGRTVHRRFFYNYIPFLLSKNYTPKFSESLSNTEVLEFFQDNPNFDALFVHDGDFIRAPANDWVSDSFVRRLFKPLSKEELLLETARDNEPCPEGAPASVTTYQVVYKPPYFMVRIFGLLCCIWCACLVFACGLFVLTSSLGKLLPNILSLANTIICNWSNLFSKKPLGFDMETFGIFMVGYHVTKVTIEDIIFGFIYLNLGIKLIRSKYWDLGMLNLDGVKTVIIDLKYLISLPILQFILHVVKLAVIDRQLLYYYYSANSFEEGSKTQNLSVFVALYMVFLSYCTLYYRIIFLCTKVYGYSYGKRKGLIIKNRKYWSWTKLDIYTISISTLISTALGSIFLYKHFSVQSVLYFPLMVTMIQHYIFYSKELWDALVSFLSYCNEELKSNHYQMVKVLKNYEGDE